MLMPLIKEVSVKRSKKIANKIRRYKAGGRAAGVAAALVLMAGGAAYAFLQSQQAKLTGNIIQTATANLQVSTDNINFGFSEPGFNFAGIVPGAPPVPQPGYNVSLKNIGNAPLNLKLAIDNQPANMDNIDLNKVFIVVTPSGGTPQNLSLKSLMDSNSSGGLAITTPSQLFAGNRMTLTLQVSMAADAVNAATASLSNFELAFSGVAAIN